MIGGNLFSEILESPQRYSAGVALWAEGEPALDAEGPDSAECPSAGPVDAARNASNAVARAAALSAFSEAQFAIAIDSAACSVSDGAILKSAHIEYAITVTRATDSEQVTVLKRYREIHAFYNELVAVYGFIARNRAIQFPMYKEGWFAGAAKNDPTSEFVQKRRVDLQSFFRLLFYHYPALFNDHIVKSFLELNAFSPAASHRYMGTMGSEQYYSDSPVTSAGSSSKNGGKGRGAGAGAKSASTEEFASMYTYVYDENWKQALWGTNGTSIADFLGRTYPYDGRYETDFAYEYYPRRFDQMYFEPAVPSTEKIAVV